MSYLENSKPVTLTELARMRTEGEKIAVLTCYDSSFAALLERNGVDVLLVDTAGRLHVKEQLMAELAELEGRVNRLERGVGRVL